MKPFEAVAMPLKRIDGPVMMIAAGDDKLALSGFFLPIAERKLAGRPKSAGDRFLYFSDAGHLITTVYESTMQRAELGPYTPVGGTPEGYARSDAVSGPAVLTFLGSALK